MTIWVITSTGLVATRKIGSLVAASTAGTISAKISALRDSRSSRVSPGLFGPRRKHDDLGAVEISRLAGADPDPMGERRGVQNVARLCGREIRAAIDQHDPEPTPRIIIALAAAAPTCPAPTIPIFMPFLPYRDRSCYPGVFPVAQLAQIADAPAPHRLRQLSAATSLMPAGRTVSGRKEKDRPGMRVWGAGDKDRDEFVAQRFGLNTELPSPFRGHENHREFSDLGDAQRACALLLQVLIGRNLREHRQLQYVNHPLRGHGVGDKAQQEGRRAR